MRHEPTGLSRRAFLIASAGASAAALAGAQAAAATSENSATKPFRYWMHGFGGGNPKDMARAMREAGFDVVVNGGTEIIEAINENGMEAWLCGGAFGLGQYENDDSHKAVDITGKPQVWFGSGSPNDPDIRAMSLKSYEDMAKTPGIKGILIDGCRFGSPASGILPFFTDFSAHSEKKAGELGFDFARMKADVRALYDLVMSLGKDGGRGVIWLSSPVGVLEWLGEHPGVLDWCRFRRVCTTEHFRNLCAVIHGAGLRTGVYIFTPSISPLVGQSYADLAEVIDVFAPMIYRNYPDRPGPACLNWELMIIPEELGLAGKPEERAAMELVLSWAGLENIVHDRTIDGIRNAMPPEAVGHQTAMARAILPADKELAPIIYIDDPEMARTADLVRENGANGLNFFVYKDTWAEMVRPAIR